MTRAGVRGRGSVSLSIDLELTLGRQLAVRQERLEALTARLSAALDQYSLPATWAVADPARSAACEGILRGKVRHEIAVLGDGAWLANGAVHSRLERELARRFEGARKEGLAVSTLALRNVTEKLDLNLLLSHGITAVRGPAREASGGNVSAARYGIWQVMSPWPVPLESGWWKPAWWGFQFRLRHAVSRGEMVHLILDAAKMVEAPDYGYPQVAVLLRQIAGWRASGKVEVGTLASLAGQSLRSRSSHPTRSLLAPAA